MENLTLISIERISRCLEGGVNRLICSFKTLFKQLVTQIFGVSRYMSGYSGREVQSFWILYPEYPGMKVQRQTIKYRCRKFRSSKFASTRGSF
jgi:hypothetical protein